MNTEFQAPAMDQQIFNMGLSVETVSAYLNVCGLKDNGEPVVLSALKATWTQSEAELENAVNALIDRNILRAEGEQLRIMPTAEWK